MMPLQDVKFAAGIVPVSINGTAATGVAIDTLDCGHVTIIFQAGAIGAADFDALKLQECETSGGSYADITGTTQTAPTQTSDNGIWVWSIPITGARMRFIKVVADPGAVDCLVSALAIKSRLVNAPTTATEAGLTGWIKLAG